MTFTDLFSLNRQGVGLLILLSIFSHSVGAQVLDKDTLGKECYELLHDEKKASGDLDKVEKCRQHAISAPVDIYVTPLRRREKLEEVPASAQVLSSREIQRSSADSVAELLRDVPGVEISDAGQPGLKRIRIRGEESRRVRILIDGQEFADEREVGTPLLIDPELIERIEVIRGTGSVLHGSRAVGGVVNIITKKGGYHPVQGTLSGSYDSSSEGYNSFGSLYGKVGDTSYRVSSSFSEHGNRHTPIGKVQDTSYDNNSYSIYLSRYLGEGHKLAFSYDNYDSSSEVYVDPLVKTTPPFLDFRIDAPKRDRSKFALFYDGTGVSETVKNIHFDTYYQDSDRDFNTFSTTAFNFGTVPIQQESDIFTSSTLKTVGVNGQIDLLVAPQHNLVLGVEAKNDDLDQARLRKVTINRVESPNETTVDEASQSTFEIFGEDAWQLSKDWEVRGGTRAFVVDSELDKSTRPGLSSGSESDSHVVGAASIRYTGYENLTIWGGWSQGYVHPTLINLGTGAFAGPSYVNPNLDLKPETSNSFEIGAHYKSKQLDADASLFYTIGRDFIDHVLCSSGTTPCIEPTGTRDRVYVNVDKATSFGGEVKIKPHVEFVEPYGNVSWIRRHFESSTQDTYRTGIPTFSTRIGLLKEGELFSGLNSWADLYLRANSDSEEEAEGGSVQRRGGWSTLNLSFGTEIKKTHNLNLVLDLINLTDKKYIPSTENFEARGRSAIVKLVANF